MKKLGLFIVLSAISTIGFAQKLQPNTGFGYYGTPNINASAIEYSTLTESDILFSKRIWREIDTKDTANWVLLAPSSRLSEIIIKSINDGELTAYETPGNSNNEYFAKILKPADVMRKLSDSVYVPKYDRDGNEVGGSMMKQEFNPNTIAKFMIMEDWIFNRNSGAFEVRILGLAPLLDFKAGNEVMSDYVPFWVYFPELRYIMATKKVALPGNDATQMTYDDWFTARLFNATVYKESNPKDLPLNVFYSGDDLKREQERIDNDLQRQMEVLTKSYDIVPVEKDKKSKKKRQAVK